MASSISLGSSKSCESCHQEPSKPQRCGQCHKAIYCGTTCQRAHWPRHKLVCKKPSPAAGSVSAPASQIPTSPASMIAWARTEINESQQASAENPKIRMLRKAAERGDAKTQTILGICYMKGEGVAKNEFQGFVWFEKAAKQGYKEAQHWLAMCYDEGIGVAKNEERAVYWCAAAAEQGHKKAQYDLAVSYRDGTGVPRDQKQALFWYEKAAEQGHLEAQKTLGRLYTRGAGVSQDLARAAFWLQRAAEQGDQDSHYNLALLSQWGHKEEKDAGDPRAVLQQAAEQGIAQAQTNYGIQCLKEKKPHEAISWFTKAATQGESHAQYLLGHFYLNRLGGAELNLPNPIEATRLFTEAANRGHAGALAEVSLLHLSGPNPRKGHHLAALAAEKGSALGLRLLGRIYQGEWGIVQPDLQLAEFFSLQAKEAFQAAETGDFL